MADTPESLVYRGREGTGYAQVFGREGNPLRAFKERKTDIERNRAIKAEQERLAREKRDKDLWELTNVNPDKAFEPFDNQVREAAEAHRRDIYNRLMQGGSTPELKLFAKNGWDKVNNMAAKSQYIKNVLADTQKSIKENPYLDEAYYFPKVNDSYLTVDGKAKPLDQIDVESIRNVYLTDPLGFKEEKYHKDYMDGLNENMNNYVRQKAVNNGILTEDVETTWKGNLFTLDPKSSTGVAKDRFGNPKLNITDDLVNSYTNSQSARNYYNAIAERDGLSMHDIIGGRFKNYGNGLKTNIRSSFSRDSGWQHREVDDGKLTQQQIDMANGLWKNVSSMVNAFTNPDGSIRDEATPEARAAAGHFLNKKFGAGTVEGFDFVKGSDDTGKSKVLGKTVDNSPNDRLVAKVTNPQGKTRIEVIDLEDEGAGISLWNLNRDNNYFGKENDVTFDVASKELGLDSKSLYKGKEGKAIERRRESELTDAWVSGKSLDKMAGRSLDGSKIVKAEPNTTWYGSDKGYKLTMEDGREVEVPKGDVKTLQKISRSKGTGTKSDFKKSYKVNGKDVSLEELRAAYSDEVIQEAIDNGDIE